MRTALFACALAAALYPLGSRAAAPPTMSISVSGSKIVVSGAIPGSEILVFSAYQTGRGYFAECGTYYKFVSDDDHDGVITADFGESVPHRSVWCAIDTRNGNSVVAAPTGYKFRLHELAPTALTKARNGDDALSLALAAAEIVIVRAGGSVWRGTVDRGGTNDSRDPDPKKLLATTGHLMTLRGKDPVPNSLAPSDVIIAVNPLTLETFVRRVSQ